MGSRRALYWASRWTAFPVPLGLGNIFKRRSLSANTEGNPLSKSFLVEEMAGDLPMAGREITAETPEEAVARVISDAVVTEDWGDLSLPPYDKAT